MIKYAFPTIAATLAVAALLSGAAPASAGTDSGTFAQTGNGVYSFEPFDGSQASFSFSTIATFTPYNVMGGPASEQGNLSFTGTSTSAPAGGKEFFDISSISFTARPGQTKVYNIPLTSGSAFVEPFGNGFKVTHGSFGGNLFEFSASAPGFSLASEATPGTPFTGGHGTMAPVPEASSVLSLGAMILLGGGALALRRRKTAAQAV